LLSYQQEIVRATFWRAVYIFMNRDLRYLRLFIIPYTRKRINPLTFKFIQRHDCKLIDRSHTSNRYVVRIYFYPVSTTRYCRLFTLCQQMTLNSLWTSDVVADGIVCELRRDSLLTLSRLSINTVDVAIANRVLSLHDTELSGLETRDVRTAEPSAYGLRST